ncbi:hypothetical protein PHYBOEH_009599 [Phytophthora boehmeriae]|uniref:Uncharacterized protein n=1 Tax=Phytophthora boehmeriae TaxID=109152 RepID=A0A8T1X5I7_9STRA|nr:hypothetical protein PHYBOEH_009599 [Phytophthora boehmeriae]
MGGSFVVRTITILLHYLQHLRSSCNDPHFSIIQHQLKVSTPPRHPTMRAVFAIAIAFVALLSTANVNATATLRGVDNAVESETRQLAEMDGSGSTAPAAVGDETKTSLEELGSKYTFGKRKKICQFNNCWWVDL